jgi:hypothetical protein
MAANCSRGSIPVADQRVPHIWPSFGQMWETRTSVSQLINFQILRAITSF